ncbi:MAG: sulfotransferase [Saprospiraceae bacterium]
MKKKYVYILSQRYSGSTLLSFLLATHPEIVTIGERRKFYNKAIHLNPQETQVCSCGEQFIDCSFWGKIRQRVLARVPKKVLRTNFTEFHFFKQKQLNRLAQWLYQTSVWLGVAPNWRPFASQVQQMLAANQILVDETLAIDGHSTFLDSSKSIEQVLYLSQLEQFDFYVIWLVRDPRAQVSSALKYNDWTVVEAAQRWKKEMENNAQWLQKMNLKQVELSYEKLCREPEAEMQRLLQFIGLDPEQFSLNFREQEQHIMGNRSMRLGSDTTITERRDWLEKLSLQERQTIERLTKNFQQYYTTTEPN